MVVTVGEIGITNSDDDGRPYEVSEGDVEGRGGRVPRLGGDDGAVLVESALVLPFLCLLLFGLIEFGINLNDYQAVRQAARDGARQAVVADYGTGACAPPGSATPAQNSQAVACTAKAGTDLSNVAAKVIFTDLNDENYAADKVRVCLAVGARSITGLVEPFLANVDLKTSVEMRAEKQLDLSTTPYQDTDPSGENWSWCS
jgi:hypothetical protein